MRAAVVAPHILEHVVPLMRTPFIQNPLVVLLSHSPPDDATAADNGCTPKHRDWVERESLGWSFAERVRHLDIGKLRSLHGRRDYRIVNPAVVQPLDGGIESDLLRAHGRVAADYSDKQRRVVVDAKRSRSYSTRAIKYPNAQTVAAVGEAVDITAVRLRAKHLAREAGELDPGGRAVAVTFVLLEFADDSHLEPRGSSRFGTRSLSSSNYTLRSIVELAEISRSGLRFASPLLTIKLANVS